LLLGLGLLLWGLLLGLGLGLLLWGLLRRSFHRFRGNGIHSRRAVRLRLIRGLLRNRFRGPVRRGPACLGSGRDRRLTPLQPGSGLFNGRRWRYGRSFRSARLVYHALGSLRG